MSLLLPAPEEIASKNNQNSWKMHRTLLRLNLNLKDNRLVERSGMKALYNFQ